MKQETLETVEYSSSPVIEGIEVKGDVNTPMTGLVANVQHSIRLGHPQIRPQPIQIDPVAIVCGGPSLEATRSELVDCIASGSKVVAVNGSYQWCLDHNIVPSMHIVMDARPENISFFTRPLPRCHYVLASQVHPNCWDRVKDWKNVWIFHVGGNDEPIKEVLDAYYLKNWHAIIGGTTVGTRAIALLRTLGYVRMDIFGMDSCWSGPQHHAYAQTQNETDAKVIITAHPHDRPDLSKKFVCAPWHVQQLKDFLEFIRFNGHQFALNIHGDGLIAYSVNSAAHLQENH